MKTTNAYTRLRLNGFAVIVALLAAYLISLFVSSGDVFGTPTPAKDLSEDGTHLVNSGPPVQTGVISNIQSDCELYLDPIDLSQYFMDPDGDAITYSAEIADRSIAFISISGDTLTINPRTVGQAEITVTATDSIDGSATATFLLSVGQFALINPPVLTSPLNGATVAFESKLRWIRDGAAQATEVQISSDMGFEELIFAAGCQAYNGIAYCSGLDSLILNRFIPLQRRETYYWRGRSRVGCTAGAWTQSPASVFTVEDLVQPQPIYPSYSANDVPLNGYLQWKLGWVDGYDIEIARDIGFSDLAVQESTDADTYDFPVGALTIGATYFWRVRGLLGSEKGPWSNPSLFTTRVEDPHAGTVGDGYMVAGEYWHTVKPMNTAEENGVEDPLDDIGYHHWLTLGPDGRDWKEPVGIWPGGQRIVSNGRDGWRMMFPVFESDDWSTYGYTSGNVIRDVDQTYDTRFMFAYYSPSLQGTADPSRNYSSDATFTDLSRSHLIYEAGWPSTAGIDFKVRAHQYTVNEQNLNDFVALEVTLTNTGVVDTDGNGTPEATDHAIDALGAVFYPIDAWISVGIGESGGRATNDFGAGRTAGYFATPDATGRPADVLAWYGNVPPDRTLGRMTPAEGSRLFGVMSFRGAEKGYTDVWNGWRWMGVKQGSIADGVDGNSPDKATLFGTHPIGDGSKRGWYTSAHIEGSLVDGRNSAKSFWSATATWYEDYGRTTTDDTKNLAPNSAFFSDGTPGDVTTFTVGNADARPNGDYKYASEDVPGAGIEQPVWEPRLNPGASDGSDFYGATGYNFEYVFSQAIYSGIGPFYLAVGESITIVWASAGGFRAEGMLDALDAAEWAWKRGWDITPDLPTPPAPDIDVASTADGHALVSWTDVSGIDSDVDGYKIWRADHSNQMDRLDVGFRALDNYQHLHQVGGDPTPYRDAVNPWFDAEAEFTASQNKYFPAEWGTYELVAKIPSGDLSTLSSGIVPGYDYSWEDSDAVPGFTYWYYVSAYKEGTFSGPFGPIAPNHIESANFNRNGRNSPDAAPGEIGLTTPWGGTYPFAKGSPDFPLVWSNRYQNLGAPFEAGTRTVSTETDEVPGRFALHPAYPNPFNPSTTITYDVREATEVRLVVYDALGRQVSARRTAHSAPGRYTTVWDASGRPSGIYFVRMEANDFIATRKIIFLK